MQNTAKSQSLVVPQWSILKAILFNSFLNDLDDEIECTPGKYVDDTKLEEVADTSECCTVIQRDLKGLKK